MEFRLRRKTTSQGEESPQKKKKKEEKFAIGEKILLSLQIFGQFRAKKIIFW